MSVGVVPIEIIDHRIDDLPGHLCSARAIEIGDFVAVVLSLERGKMGPDLDGGRYGQPTRRDRSSCRLGFELQRRIQGQLPLITFATI